MDFVEICKVYIGKVIIKAAKRIFNSGKICHSYSDLNFGVTFLKHSVVRSTLTLLRCAAEVISYSVIFAVLVLQVCCCCP